MSGCKLKVKCSIDGCENNRDGMSLMCSKHRKRKRLYGDPNITKNRKPGEGFFANGYKATQINGIKKFDHVRIAEKALGKELPEGAVIHHADGCRDNNDNSNLVICPNRAYHNFLHARIDAMKETGDPTKRKCRICKKYDDLEKLVSYVNNTTTSYWHKSCASEYAKKKYQEKKENAVLY